MKIPIRYLRPLLLGAALAATAACLPFHRAQPQPSLDDCLAGQRLGAIAALVGDPLGQGKDLLGFGFMDSRTFVRVDRFDLGSAVDDAGLPIVNVQVRSRALSGMSQRTETPLDGRSWRGAAITGQLHCSNPKLAGKTRSIKARIVEPAPGETPPLGTGTEPLWMAYRIELLLDDGRRIASACRDPGDVAFPILGYWNDAGHYVRDPKKLSFACTRRHVATCLKQGYLDDTGSADRRALLEACTRMMRADYCGNGDSYTKDGTFITLWDNRNFAAKAPREPLTFEGAWTAKGLACNARLRWSEAEVGVPTCLRDRPRPRCSSAEEAKALFPGVPLVFNDSCTEHPCRTKSRVEPFEGPAPQQAGPESCPRTEERAQLFSAADAGGSAGRR
ncbi:MAG TPA: ADYC domain-containing protein [Kofleriaceae bacterium]|nr:ADYC domain-containing protein [Kofleriaceae bacterium]